MKNIIILGAGRSGTSLVASLFAEAGYFMGESLYEGRDANPLGFFESWDVNGINENLLSKEFPSNKKWWQIFNKKATFQTGQRWLINPTGTINFVHNGKTVKDIKKLIAQQPFCYKDPRFSFTLPIWKKYLPANTVCIVVFRHPFNTALSILKECNSDVPYLKDVDMTIEKALSIWLANYKTILKIVSKNDNFLFLNYEELINNPDKILTKVELYTEAKLFKSNIKMELYRNNEKGALDNQFKVVYNKLLELASE